MDKQIEELANDLQEAWTAWSLSADLPKPWTFVAEILAKKWQPKVPECVVDYIANYKEGFKEGVVAVQTQLKGRLAERKEICEGRWKRYEKEGETDLSAYWSGKDNEIYCVKADIDEICKGLVDE